MLYTILILTLTAGSVLGQSCCSGGAPLSGNLGLPMVDGRQVQFSISYDLNKLNTLKSGTETLDDNTRTRTTHTALFQAGYNIDKHWSFEILLPYVQQEREVSPLGLGSTVEITNGIGDIVFLSKYRFLNHFQAGLGVKFPTGSSDETTSRGILLNADMQPGSGAWDGIAFFTSEHQLKSRNSLSVYSTWTYRFTGKNNSYLIDQVYEFGNEAQVQVGVADQFLIFNQLIGPSLSFKYRNVSADINDGFDVPSTGGSWLFIKPGLSYLITPTINLVTTLDLPLYANLEGTQVTPTFRWNTALLFNLKLR
ncbi:MAG: transporter [Reichenbachiella sp.]|uniref:transporter n=3 Tax=Reichenbachiella sp. TaxID=2184521 RepID=UPI0032636DB9